jgi:hypothetical protein
MSWSFEQRRVLRPRVRLTFWYVKGRQVRRRLRWPVSMDGVHSAYASAAQQPEASPRHSHGPPSPAPPDCQAPGGPCQCPFESASHGARGGWRAGRAASLAVSAAASAGPVWSLHGGMHRGSAVTRRDPGFDDPSRSGHDAVRALASPSESPTVTARPGRRGSATVRSRSRARPTARWTRQRPPPSKCQ